MNRRKALTSIVGGLGLTMLATRFSTHAKSPESRKRNINLNKAATGSGELTYPYELADLPYRPDALEPSIDERTMEIHHTRHHQAYINNLNTALEDHAELQQMTLGELMADIDALPGEVRTTIRNNGGGHYNHDLFWKLLTPEESRPHGNLEEAINQTFGSVDEMKEAFNDNAGGVFGSGWGWLATDEAGNLELVQTANQDTPIELGLYPVIGVDVWEHAYYLNYQNRRGDYLENFCDVLNWEQAEENYNRVL